jgi:hypothetical protein
VFAAAILAAGALWFFTAMTWPHDVVLPLVSSFLFLCSALIAFMAWRRGRRRYPQLVDYWDVAGAVTLVGICVATLVEPEQMVRLVAGAGRND